MRMAALRALIARLLYPAGTVCIACGALHVDDVRRGLCSACAEKLQVLQPPFCSGCGEAGWATLCPSCAARPSDALDGRISAYAYSDTVRALVQALKYGSVLTATVALADGMEAVMPQEWVDAMVPVPLHRTREKQRGYNQAERLSAALSARVGVPVLDAIARDRSTKTQTRLDRERRAENVRGAFSVCAPVAGLTLLLVDDVLTTGATALACAQALKEAGAARVLLLTAARANQEDSV